MKYYFAPMEGITTHVFRAVHSRRFPGADRYYTPFFSPTSDHLFTPRELRELTPSAPRTSSGPPRGCKTWDIRSLTSISAARRQP